MIDPHITSYQEDDQGNEEQAEEDEDERKLRFYISSMATDLGMLSLVGTPPMPPSGIQNYNPQGADVEDSQPFFQYSQCTGKKKGLFVCSFFIVGQVTSRVAPTFRSESITLVMNKVNFMVVSTMFIISGNLLWVSGR